MNEPVSKVLAFEGYYRFLSNFWPCEVRFMGVMYPSSEHAYQAAKTLDTHERAYILSCRTPGAAKRAGKLMKLRADWDQVKDEIMYLIVKDKFTRNPGLRDQLLATTADLEEGNWWGDRYWGICPVNSTVGENRLGKILMKVREELRK